MHHTVPQIDLYNHPEFLTVLHRTADCARARMPDAEARILRASMLVLNGHVHADTLIPQAWIVDSESQAGVAYQVIDNVCTCESYTRHQGTPDGLYYCKHVLSVFLYRRVAQRLGALAPAPQPCCQAPIDEDGEPCCAVQDDCDHEPHWRTGGAHSEPQAAQGKATDAALLAPYVVHIHGKPFIRYAGLLSLAHSKGLLKLEARFITVTTTFAVAEATATFTNGRVFTEASEATEENVGPQVRLHFARMALVRAKARALRDALNIRLCTLEELGSIE